MTPPANRLPLLPDAPFVLLDDARPGGGALLLTDPTEFIVAREAHEVGPALERLRGAGTAAGFIAYEAGHALDSKLAPLIRPNAPDAPPLLWFARFAERRRLDAEACLPDPAGAWCGPARPLIDRAAYDAALGRLREHILDGDIYQANMTFAAEARFAGHPLALYAALRRRARAGHSAIIWTGAEWILSLSPESFFQLKDGKVMSRPMKGTALRGASAKADADAVEALAADPKQRAENLMIVDLIRNDLSRVAEAGTVEVPTLFKVETYPTVHQMVSTVTARLADGRDAIDVIRALFPCGSITGAPKIRAMEILDGLETGPRGVYCGAIGLLSGPDNADFNVAIRTLVVKPGASIARLGLGSGIVADSRAADEWRECLAKGAFVATGQRFDLIETMRLDAYEGIIALDDHLARMKASASALGFEFDRHHARNELQAASFGTGPAMVRLLLARSGAMSVEIRPLPQAPLGAVRVATAPLPVSPHDFRLRHKTSDRAFYRDALAKAGTFEVLFTDPDGFLTEGSFTNLFVKRDGRMLTPPLARGLLPGILRAQLLEEGRAVEADLRPEDLVEGFLIGNAVRGLIPAFLG